MKITAFNYVEKSERGAVAIRIDGGTIYFHSQQIIAVHVNNFLYRHEKLTTGIATERIKMAIQKVSAGRVILTSSAVLKELATGIVVHAGGEEMKRRLENL